MLFSNPAIPEPMLVFSLLWQGITTQPPVLTKSISRSNSLPSNFCIVGNLACNRRETLVVVIS
ncbi:MAG: hypothetical protein HRK26_01610 [Rickettsiaceae bacterium H1]|nr:hypothetical protein [Rickettsiaceae bacterium H1]